MTKVKNFFSDNALFLLFILVLYLWFGWVVYSTFFIHEDKIITFQVVGITNSTNSSSLMGLHYECIKYCMGHTSSSYDRSNCWEQCSLLGREGCINDSR